MAMGEIEVGEPFKPPDAPGNPCADQTTAFYELIDVGPGKCDADGWNWSMRTI